MRSAVLRLVVTPTNEESPLGREGMLNPGTLVM